MSIITTVALIILFITVIISVNTTFIAVMIIAVIVTTIVTEFVNRSRLLATFLVLVRLLVTLSDISLVISFMLLVILVVLFFGIVSAPIMLFRPRTKAEAPARRWGFSFGHVSNVSIALINGVTIALSCWAGKIQDNQICFLTSLEPDKVYLRSIGNNKGVTIICFQPEIFRFY